MAHATPSSITFDLAERWELQGARHPQREFVPFDEQYFALLPVALHEIGHVRGSPDLESHLPKPHRNHAETGTKNRFFESISHRHLKKTLSKTHLKQLFENTI